MITVITQTGCVYMKYLMKTRKDKTHRDCGLFAKFEIKVLMVLFTNFFFFTLQMRLTAAIFELVK